MLSQIQPMWLPPITTRVNYHQSINRSIQTSLPTQPVPETDYLYRCFSLLGLFKRSRSCSLCEVLFCHAVISERFSRVCLPVDNLDCLSVYDCLLPAYSDPACLAELFYCLFAACLDPQHELGLWICPAFVISDARYWFLPVWLVLWFNKAAHRSLRHYLLITCVQKAFKVTLIQKGHVNLTKSDSQEICNV